MRIKASALLCIVAIWAAMIPAVAAEPGQWWTLIFAFLATSAIGPAAWRRLGLSRVIAVAGIWAGTAISASQDVGWPAVFAFLATAATVHSVMRPNALLNGLGVASAWLATGAVIRDAGGGPAWICIFAFLTAATVSSHRSQRRGVIAVAAWAAAGAVMISQDGWYWLAVVAWLLSTVAMGGGFRIPRGIDWDLWDRDDRDISVGGR